MFCSSISCQLRLICHLQGGSAKVASIFVKINKKLVPSERVAAHFWIKCWQNSQTCSLFSSFHAAFFKCLNPDQTASWILSALWRFVAIIHQYYRRCCKRDVRLRDKYRGMEPRQWAGTPVAIIRPSSCSQYETKAQIFFRWRVMQWVQTKGMPRPLLIQHQVITVISPSHSVLKSENMKHTASKRPQVFARARSNLCVIRSPSKIHGTNPSDTCA